MCWSAMVEMGFLFIGWGVVYHKTGLHGLLFISTIDLLQPPRATVHRPSISSSLHLRLFVHELLFIQPPLLLHRLLFNQPSPWGPVQPHVHGLLFIQPSTCYYSTIPPRGPAHPTLHRVLFIQPNRLDRGPVHPAATASTTKGSCSSNPPPGTVLPPPNNAHCSSREGGGMVDQLQLAAVAKESLDRV